MDSSVVPTRHPGLFLVSTTDFFYPNVEDPYLQGRVTAANVLSDLYAMGVCEVDTTLMLLALSTDMEASARDIATTELIRGFSDTVRLAGSSVTGGQTVNNPWPVIGGVAMSTVSESEMIRPGGAVAGDVLILTKPIGTQLAVNMWQRRDDPDKWAKVAPVLTRAQAARAYDIACDGMSRLNRSGARLMHEHGAHAGTDVTGFGLLGHARNLAAHTSVPVRLVIHTLPVIAGMAACDATLGHNWRLAQGFSAETSGGLLVALPAGRAQAYLDAVSAADGRPAWIIGRVEEGVPGAREEDMGIIAADAVVIEVDHDVPPMYDYAPAAGDNATNSSG